VGEAVDKSIAALAARQHGHVTRSQLLGLGLGPNAIHHRVKVGRLYRVFAGVYAVGHPPRAGLDRAAAAVLACGAGTVLSHASAATLWGVRHGGFRGWSSPLEVTAPSSHSYRGIRVHRSRVLTPKDKRTQLGIHVTSPARTLLDVAAGLDDRALARAVNDLRISRHLRIDDLTELLERVHKHPGAARLQPIVGAPRGPTRSVFEDAFVAFAQRYDLPTPQVNVRVAGHEVDAVFVVERVIVELDGFEYHGDRGAFERDRDRDADTLAAGFVTVRITWERLTRSADHEGRRLQAILRKRRV